MIMDINEADNDMGFMVHVRKESSTVHSIFLCKSKIPNVAVINNAISQIYEYMAKNSVLLPYDRTLPGKEGSELN